MKLNLTPGQGPPMVVGESTLDHKPAIPPSEFVHMERISLALRPTLPSSARSMERMTLTLAIARLPTYGRNRGSHPLLVRCASADDFSIQRNVRRGYRYSRITLACMLQCRRGSSGVLLLRAACGVHYRGRLVDDALPTRQQFIFP